MNLYGYVNNRPIWTIDPDGRHPVLIAVVVALLYGTAQAPGTNDPPCNPPVDPGEFLGDILDPLGNGLVPALENMGVSESVTATADNINKAKKLLTQFPRLLEKFGKKLPLKRLTELCGKRDNKTIKDSDLPGTLQNDFPPELKGKTLDEIEKIQPSTDRRP